MEQPAPRRGHGRAFLLWSLVVPIAAVLAGWLLTTYSTLVPVRWRQPAPVLIRATDRVDAWRQDVDYLAHELPRLHFDAFHTTSRAEFEAAVAELRAAVPDLSDDAITVRLAALVASIGDGHTALDTWPLLTRSSYPIRLVQFQEGLAVWSATAEHADLVGMRLVRLDGTPIEAVMQALVPLVAADNDSQRIADIPRYLTSPAVVAAMGLAADAQAPRFTFENTAGDLLVRELYPLASAPEQAEWVTVRDRYPLDELPLALTNRTQWYWFTVLPDEDALYFQYNVCAEMEGRPFAPFATELFAALDAAGVTRVIVDLRYNGGGNSAVINPFLDGLAARPDLQLYTLIGRNTFSSALMNAVQLQARGAVLVGEPTGGRPNHYGEVRSFTLPNSGLQVSYSTRYFRMLADADPPALLPDIATPSTLANQFTGFDAALHAALTDSR